METDRLIEQATNAAGGPLAGYLPYVVALAACLVVLYVVWKLLGRKPAKLPRARPDLTIEVDALRMGGPVPGTPRLEYYNIPVRLAAIVAAPAGRARPLPPLNELGALFESVVPGLAEVVATHGSLVRRWPEQLSTRGFALSFFRNAQLPGDAGKNTPWCSAAGAARFEGQAVMVGMLMESAEPNAIGQFIVEHETKWLDLVRVKPA